MNPVSWARRYRAGIVLALTYWGAVAMVGWAAVVLTPLALTRAALALALLTAVIGWMSYAHAARRLEIEVRAAYQAGLIRGQQHAARLRGRSEVTR